MPTLEVLDKLKAQVNELGDEPRLLAERGETLQDIAPPESPLDSDLEQLLSEDDSGGGIDEMEALLGSYTDDFSLDDLEPPAGDSSADTGADNLEDFESPEFSDDDFSLDDLVFGEDETAEPPGGDDFPPDNLKLEETGLPDEQELAGGKTDGDVEDIAADDYSLDELILGEDDSAELTGEDFTIDNPDFGEDEPAELPGSDDFSSDSFEPGEVGSSEEPEISGSDETAGAGEDLSADDFSLDDLNLGEDETGELPGDDFSVDDLDLGEVEPADVPGSDDFSLDSLDLGETGSPVEMERPESDETVGDFDDLPADDFSLGDLNFDENEPPAEPELSGDDFSPDGTDDSLEEPVDLEELEDLEDTDGDSNEIPDVESAVEGLGDLDSLDMDSETELSLDEELNFDEELGTDVLSDIREAGDESQQFSMDDFGDQYNFKEGDEAYTDSLGVDLEELEQSLDEAAEGESRPFSIDEDDFNSLRRTLASLPRNLKIALEELLADERRNPEDIKPLIEALIIGESPKSLVARFRTLTKRKIELPKTYEKRSGLLLEERRASLVYNLVRDGWPVIRVILLVISIAWVLGVAVFMWVYRPVMAERLYAKGLESVAADELGDAVMYFYDAWDGWPLFYSEGDGTDRIADSPIVVKGWKNNERWLDYARALRRRKHWDTAEQFYSGYLSIKPDSKDVRLEYSSFLSGILGKYEEAVAVLENAPASSGGRLDRDYTLSAGDVFLEWAEDDPTKYEEARYRYAKILETSRNDERAILSMMRYHLRLADDTEIDRLLPIFDREVPGRTEEPSLASEVYAGLGEYHLARGNAEESRRFIDLSLGADPAAPEASYVDAIFWRYAGDSGRELQSYKRTLVNLDNRESLNRSDLKMKILTLGGIGRIQSERAYALVENPGQAAEARSLATVNYRKAADLYEDARMRNQLGASPEFGRLYLELGDLMYRGRQSDGDLQLTLGPLNREALVPGSERYDELVQAEENYNQAQELFSRGPGSPSLPPGTHYRRGYARYVLGLDDAMLDFHRVARERPEDYEVRLALAAALLDSGDYEASRSQYSRALELLDDELRGTGGVLSPFERKSHEELLLRYVIAWNNLGVGRARSAARGGGEDDYAGALSAFTMASEYLDGVFNDMTEINSRGASGLRDTEERRIVSQVEGRNLLKEKTTVPYINRLRLLGLDKAENGEDTYLMYPDIPSDLN